MLCGNIVKVATNKHPALKSDSEKVKDTFTEVLDLFGKCHKGYNSAKYMNDGQIKQLGEQAILHTMTLH